MIRSILAVVLGILVAMSVTWVVQLPCAVLYPLPKELKPENTEAFRAYVATLPVGAFLLVLLSWFAGAFCGAWLAARIARRFPLVHALIVAAVSLAAGFFELLSLPHPTWFVVASLLAFPVAAIAAAALNRPKAATSPLAA
jgi:hypothetical protein